MHRHIHHALSRTYSRHVGAIIFAAALISLAFFLSGNGSAGFSSAEVKFADASRSGLSIVPASCPSDPHSVFECAALGGACSSCSEDFQCSSGNCNKGWGICEPVSACFGGAACSSCSENFQCSSGNCNKGQGICEPVASCSPPQCTPQFYCSGKDLYYTNSSCQNSFQQTCSYVCSPSGCVPPPSPAFAPFDATYKGSHFNASGHLQVKPVLIRAGDSVQVYWKVTNVSSCSVTGTNGDSWSGDFSGTAGKTSGPVTAQTIYTLNCQALSGATPPSLSETATVNIIPVFEET